MSIFSYRSTLFPSVLFRGSVLALLLLFPGLFIQCRSASERTISPKEIAAPAIGSIFTFERNGREAYQEEVATNSDTAHMQIFASGIAFQGKTNTTLLGVEGDTIAVNYEPNGNISFYGVSVFPWTTFPTGSDSTIEQNSTTVENAIYTTVNKLKTSIEKWDTLLINGKTVPCMKLKQYETSSLGEVDPNQFGTVITASMWFAPSLGIPVKYATEHRTKEQNLNHHLLYSMNLLSFELKR